MFKLIVNAPNGIQEVVTIEESGGYFDESLVVWDERKDGPLTDQDLAKIGGLTKQDGKLVVNDLLKKQTEDLLKAIKDDQDKSVADKVARTAIFKDIDKINSINDVKACLKAIVKEFKLD